MLYFSFNYPDNAGSVAVHRGVASNGKNGVKPFKMLLVGAHLTGHFLVKYHVSMN